LKANTIIEIPKYDITSENIHSIVQKEIGIVFTKVLEDAGVYKKDHFIFVKWSAS
jgi:galactose-1-phosphate uridylyltransferase